MAALVFGLAAVAGLGTLGASLLWPGGGSAVGFASLAAVAVFAAAKVVTHAKPVYSAVYFILVVTAVDCLMIVQEAEFLGIALIIVYAGAILVTYVFVIMLAQQSGAAAVDNRARRPFGAVLAGFVMVAAVSARMADLPEASHAVHPRGHDAAMTVGAGNTAGVGAELLSRYVVALEIAGVLLLVAMIGAIVMAQKRVPLDVPREEAPAPGEIGRAVQPF
jgi:NADH-quinone oxidoreductase subunit J